MKNIWILSLLVFSILFSPLGLAAGLGAPFAVIDSITSEVACCSFDSVEPNTSSDCLFLTYHSADLSTAYQHTSIDVCYGVIEQAKSVSVAVEREYLPQQHLL